MVKPDVFAVEFDERGIYAPGDTLTGKVIIHARDTPLNVDQLVVQFCGAARVFWSEKELVPQTQPDDSTRLFDHLYPQYQMTSWNGQKELKAPKQPVHMRSVAYANDRIYFDESRTLWQAANSDDQLMEDERMRHMYHHAGNYRLKLHNIVNYDKNRIDAILAAADSSISTNNNATLFPLGKHEFPFTYTLPDSIPTSFHSASKHCSIRYFVKAQLNHYNTCKYQRKEHFAVVRPFDLNLMPAVGRPITIDGYIESTSGGCRSREASIAIKMHLGRRAYVPGEKLDVKITITNEWFSALKHINLSLFQLVEYHAFNSTNGRLKSKSEEIKLISVVEPAKVRAHSGEHVWCPSVYVPALTPTLLTESDLITVEYSLECTIFGRHKRTRLLHLNTPLLIGTVSLNQLPPQIIPDFSEVHENRAPLPSYNELVETNNAKSQVDDTWSDTPDTANAPPPYEPKDLIQIE